jgi:hypothetical protein
MRIARRVFALGLAVFLLGLFVFAPTADAKKRKAAPTAPGTYTDWGDDFDRIEIVETFSLGDYQRLVVGEFDTSETPLPPEDDNSYARVRQVLGDVNTSLMQGLEESGLGLTVARQEGDAPAGEGTLLVRGRVLQMDPGSRAARYWAGFGAGAARTQLEGEVVDAASGRVLFRFTQERRSGVGVGGGSYVELLNRNLRAIGEDLGGALHQF